MTRSTAEIAAEIKVIEAQIATDRRVMHEGDQDMPTQFDAKRIALGKELEAAYEAEQSAEWSRENTIARRAAWNEAVNKISAKRKMVWADIAEVQKTLGFEAHILKEAIARHGL